MSPALALSLWIHVLKIADVVADVVVCACGARLHIGEVAYGVPFTCSNCAPKPSQKTFFDVRKSKTSDNPYRHVRFRFQLEPTEDFPRRVSYTDSWEANVPPDDTTDDPNIWRETHCPANTATWFLEDADVPTYWLSGGRVPKARGHLPWLMLNDRSTTSDEKFAYLPGLGDIDFDSHTFGPGTPLRDSRQGGVTRIGLDAVLAAKQWSDTAKKCVRAVMLHNFKAVDVARCAGVKISTLYSYVRDAKAEIERAGADPNFLYIRQDDGLNTRSPAAALPSGDADTAKLQVLQCR